MKLLVTGATGFVGSFVVAEALRQGWDVYAVTRPKSANALSSIADHERLHLVKADLRDGSSLSGLFDGIDACIHLAASKGGDFPTQFAATVVGTENLLNAMPDHVRLVGVSTFSVYGYADMASGSMIDERSPLESSPLVRDEYAQTKLIQESLYRDQVDKRHVVILRPGMIYGKDNLFHPLLGSEMGPVFLRVGSRATMPMTYVENCAEAIVAAAAQRNIDSGTVINIVDNNLPTQQQFVNALARQGHTTTSITVPWPAMSAATRALGLANDKLVGGNAKFPGMFSKPKLDGRFKPFMYSNKQAKQMLAFDPQITLDEAIRRSLSSDDWVRARAFSNATESVTHG